MDEKSSRKQIFLLIIAMFSLVLLTLPFVLTFNEGLTQIIEKNRLYGWIQETIVPVEAKMMGALLLPFGYDFAVVKDGSGIVVNGLPMSLTWNCLGWQSFLLFLITLAFGFRGRFTKRSILEAAAIGILGTFWLNIGRMLFTVVLAVHLPSVFRIVFHDYLAAFTTIIWLFLFWWLVYGYVLEEKKILAEASND